MAEIKGKPGLQERFGKRIRRFVFLAFLLPVTGLCGCDAVTEPLEEFAGTVGSFTEDAIEDLRDRMRYRDEDEQYVINVVEEELPQTVITINDDDYLSVNNAARLSGNAISGLRINELSGVIDNYAYTMLYDDERVIYDEIYDLLVNFKEDTILSTVDTDLIDHAFSCVLIDHPEIFYIKGYTIKTYTREGVIEKITMNGTYTMSQTQVLEMLSELTNGSPGSLIKVLVPVPPHLFEYPVIVSRIFASLADAQNIFEKILQWASRHSVGVY